MAETQNEVLETFAQVNAALGEAGVGHAYLGALAALAWGRVRATSDLDLVIAAVPQDWERLQACLVARGLRLGKAVGPSDPAEALPDLQVCWSSHHPGVRVDIFLAKTAFEQAALGTARPATVFGAPIRVVRPEASIVYKLLAGRRKDLDDVEGIFLARAAAGDALDWAFLDHWAADWEIGDRLAPYRARFGPTGPG